MNSNKRARWERFYKVMPVWISDVVREPANMRTFILILFIGEIQWSFDVFFFFSPISKRSPCMFIPMSQGLFCGSAGTHGRGQMGAVSSLILSEIRGVPKIIRKHSFFFSCANFLIRWSQLGLRASFLEHH